MEAFEAIKARKSVRTYQDRPVETEKIKAIVEAGYMAAGTPMAGKVYFNAISNKELLTQICQSSSRWESHLSNLIFRCVDKQNFKLDIMPVGVLWKAHRHFCSPPVVKNNGTEKRKCR